MFADRFDALMNIAEVSNSLLGRAISINSSHIGRLRTGTRPLPKKHAFLAPMCLYLAGHIRKNYQRTALQKLTGISNAALDSVENTAQHLENWLMEKERDTAAATGRLISGFSWIASHSAVPPAGAARKERMHKTADHLYSNAGKRKAVEQFFLLILQEEQPQTLLLFSDENMSWLYEDTAFAARWVELFTQVLLRGNRVRIIHTVSRDMNEMLEAITKWIPIYMTGMIEPYSYPRLRDGVFHRTLFIAPRTAAVVSSSVMEKTEGMLNHFITDKPALEALTAEYENFFRLCRPLMRVFTASAAKDFHKAMGSLVSAEGAACLYTAMPPLFALSKKAARELAEQTGSEMLMPIWQQSLAAFCRDIKKQRLSLMLLEPQTALADPDKLYPPMAELLALRGFVFSQSQYTAQLDRLTQLAAQYDNLTVAYRSDVPPGLLLYVKEDAGAVLAKSNAPMSAFVIGERNMTCAFWDYMTKMLSDKA